MSWYPYERRPRRAVQGGVKVPRPGTVTNQVALALLQCLESMTRSTVAARGRTYARAGQVVEVRIDGGEAAAAIQGTGGRPYTVWLGAQDDGGSATARCNCPYGCSEVEWCKHAAALAYVVADLVEHDREMERLWSGVVGEGTARDTGGGAGPGAETAALVTILRAGPGAGPGAAVDGQAQWRAVVEILPPPL